jgi:hypothetical protein
MLHPDTAPKANASIRSEFRVYAADAVMRRNRLKAELRTGAMRECAGSTDMEKPLDLQKLFLAIRGLLDEPDDVRVARLAGRPSEFHYIPTTMQEPDENKSPWRSP